MPETSAMSAKPNSLRNKLPNTSVGSIVNRKIPTGEKNFFMPPSKNLFPSERANNGDRDHRDCSNVQSKFRRELANEIILPTYGFVENFELYFRFFFQTNHQRADGSFESRQIAVVQHTAATYPRSKHTETSNAFLSHITRIRKSRNRSRSYGNTGTGLKFYCSCFND